MKHDSRTVDVVVVGGGHAGCEAADAAARLGAETLLITHRFDRIGEMSCNPAIGGLGKGHLVREVDALDGLMGRVADAAGIQFRVLNRSRGPAVRGQRAQCDRDIYRATMQAAMRERVGLSVLEDEVVRLRFEDGKVGGVETSSSGVISCKSVVITTGTFLRGVMHVGHASSIGGRVGDPSSTVLADQLSTMGFRIGRLKTGTPARLRAESINWACLDVQKGDEIPEPFSFLTGEVKQDQICCFVTQTNEHTHQIIRENLGESAMYGGVIEGRGPRYCPSIEDKITRFAEKSSHNVFLEPETRTGELVYPNGVSTSLPEPVQTAFLRTMKGLEDVVLARPGYAIEYDFVDPTDLYSTLETKRMPGLFLAGQINGTTGYEEAAALGLMAGLNAARRAADQTGMTLSRSQAYIGVLVDDLVTKGVTEPYRMFTSRAEYRLSLRADNADERLTGLGRELGLVSEVRERCFRESLVRLTAVRRRLGEVRVSPHEALRRGVTVNQDGTKRTLSDLLGYPGVTFQLVAAIDPELEDTPPWIQARVEADALYSGLLARERELANQADRYSEMKLPRGIDYLSVPSLTTDQRQKLAMIQPLNLGQAERIEGITPAAITALMPYVDREDRSERES